MFSVLACSFYIMGATWSLQEKHGDFTGLPSIHINDFRKSHLFDWSADPSLSSSLEEGPDDLTGDKEASEGLLVLATDSLWSILPFSRTITRDMQQ